MSAEPALTSMKPHVGKWGGQADTTFEEQDDG